MKFQRKYIIAAVLLICFLAAAGFVVKLFSVHEDIINAARDYEPYSDAWVSESISYETQSSKKPCDKDADVLGVDFALETPLLTSTPEPLRGMDDTAFAIWQSGVLDAHIPKGDKMYSAKCADLNLDGISDVLMLTDSAAPRAAMHYTKLRTFILLGDGEGGFAVAARDNEIAYANPYGDSTVIHIGDGWFKFENSVGKAGGYEYCRLYEYDLNDEEWVLTEYYHNWYGYNEFGISAILTPLNFGRQVFGSALVETVHSSPTEYAYKNGDISVSGEWAEISLQDAEKQQRINDMLKDDYLRMAEYLTTQDADVFLRANILLQSPQVLCVEYEVWGEVNGINLMGAGRRYTRVIDLETEEYILLADVIDIDAWKEYACTEPERWAGEWGADISSALSSGFEYLPDYCDDFEALLSPECGGYFWAVHERSLAIYWQPNFWNPSNADMKICILSDYIRPYVKLDLWSYRSKAAEHIEWHG